MVASVGVIAQTTKTSESFLSICQKQQNPVYETRIKGMDCKYIKLQLTKTF